jgi:hypothetical protein
MKCVRIFLVACLLFCLAGAAAAADAPPLLTAQGAVEKAGKDTLTVQPRGSGGKFGKSVTLKLTGTSKLFLLATRAGTGGKVVITQREADLKDLKPKQAIAVIYTSGKEGEVLLVGVVQPSEK